MPLVVAWNFLHYINLNFAYSKMGLLSSKFFTPNQRWTATIDHPSCHKRTPYKICPHIDFHLFYISSNFWAQFAGCLNSVDKDLGRPLQRKTDGHFVIVLRAIKSTADINVSYPADSKYHCPCGTQHFSFTSFYYFNPMFAVGYATFDWKPRSFV